MEGLKSWAFSLCCAAVAGSILSLMLPDSSLGKVCRFSIRIFLLCCLVLPLGTFGEIFLSLPQMEMETQDYTDQINIVVAEQIRVNTANSLEESVEAILRQQEVPYQKIEAIVNTGKDGSISISCIRISLPPDIQEDSPETLYRETLELIERVTGVETEFAAENGGKTE